VPNKEFLLPFLITLFAGLSTGIGSVAAIFIKEFKHRYLSLMLGFSSGVMVYVSFVELLGKSIEKIGFVRGNLSFFAGILIIFLIDKFIPHNYLEERIEGTPEEKKLMAVGLFTVLGITIHNFPEGMGVFFSSFSDLSIGIPLAIAIAVHNIPEGICVSMPIFYATKSKKKAFVYSFLSGIAEPVGAVVGYLILRPFINEVSLAVALSMVGGIMVFISFDELLPVSFKSGEEHIAILGVFIGMVVMAVSLSIL
jgi:ZIP family zinc transporter